MSKSLSPKNSHFSKIKGAEQSYSPMKFPTSRNKKTATEVIIKNPVTSRAYVMQLVVKKGEGGLSGIPEGMKSCSAPGYEKGSVLPEEHLVMSV